MGMYTPVSASSTPEEQTSEDATELRCGYGRCRPDCLQRGNNSRGLLACLSYMVFIEGFLVNGINNINVSSLERRFDLPSARVAWVSSAYDLSAALASPVFGYIGMFAHKGYVLTMTSASMAIGAFIMFLPHLLVGHYELGTPTSDECDIYGNVTRCTEHVGRDDADQLYVLIAGMVFVGIGGSAVYLLGTTWLDDNLPSKDTPLYLGVLHSFSALGPAVAFVAGGAILDNVYVDANKVISQELNIDKGDPRWVGAWWIGFLISSLFCAIIVLLVSCFPRLLPDAIHNRDKRQSQAYRGHGDKETAHVNFGRSWKDVVISLRIVFTNPPWIFVTLAGILESGAVMAFNTFLPKMLQFQFAMTPGMAAIFAGAVVVPGAAIGQILGGLIPRWADLKVRGLFIQCGICSVVAGVMAPIMLLRCDMPRIAGVTVSYNHNSSSIVEPSSGSYNLYDTCNAHCNCTSRSYEPLCDAEGVEYFSPCHAGCLETTGRHSGDSQLYKSCSCIEGFINDDVSPTNQWQAEEGICSSNCNKLKIFMPLLMVIVLATFISNTAGQAVVLRCVPDKNRSFAYGIQSSIIRLLGNVPGPILFGVIFDQSCMVWKDSCESRGSCWIYDNAALSWRLFLIIIIVKTISGFMFFMAAIVYKAPEEATHLYQIDINETTFNNELPSEIAQSAHWETHLDTSNGKVSLSTNL